MCSFEFLAALEVNKEEERGAYRVYKNSSFFRKGEVGDWKEHLSPEMAEKIDRVTREKMSQYAKDVQDLEISKTRCVQMGSRPGPSRARAWPRLGENPYSALNWAPGPDSA
ncbi:uncharacterized protein A4U43_C09F2060 [Asparagus officinalis]|uniref:Sulfotransferase n=1 Tax=Asparagus officinalis TaxID=4686 RepID=A0A5P1E4N1_ASPOF|nr:uncharacterized protein A4U43_C09F2060 [Asparagus officinalis]